ncbi:hypothetical protein Y032_0103g3535 [Ancylostoma ceylanicum]|uniref:Uncharacterized protein n=1 Tax=Ancylostoma ceylanicum TaxID=53326 RepID=A0A016TH29_9BILA|nr:hypothetical protein Y032_0103g3535 [Ancylostoma ceylanicum]
MTCCSCLLAGMPNLFFKRIDSEWYECTFYHRNSGNSNLINGNEATLEESQGIEASALNFRCEETAIDVVRENKTPIIL